MKYTIVNDALAHVSIASRVLGFNPLREISPQAAGLLRAYTGLKIEEKQDGKS